MERSNNHKASAFLNYCIQLSRRLLSCQSRHSFSGIWFLILNICTFLVCDIKLRITVIDYHVAINKLIIYMSCWDGFIYMLICMCFWSNLKMYSKLWCYSYNTRSNFIFLNVSMVVLFTDIGRINNNYLKLI